VCPLIIVASKRAPGQGHRLRTALGLAGGARVRQSELRGGGPWILVPDRVRDALAELEAAGPRMGEKLVCHLGVKTGANHVFLNPPPDIEPEVVRWALRGRDLRPFHCRPRTTLLWTHDPAGRPLPGLPARAAAYLGRQLQELRARKDYKSGVPWAVFRARPAVAAYRVVWADLARQLTAAALTTTRDRERIPLNSCYVAPVPSRSHAQSLAAWLNSTPIRAAARSGAVPAASNFARFNAQCIARVPLSDTALDDPDLSRIEYAGRSGADVQEELDHIVSRHLHLSPSAQHALRGIVDGVGTPNRR
jgi:hypothetical protein